MKVTAFQYYNPKLRYLLMFGYRVSLKITKFRLASLFGWEFCSQEDKLKANMS